MKIKATLLITFIFLNGMLFIANAQTLNDTLYKIDIENLKNQSYLKLANRINCDSTTGTTIEERVCANLELQKQDSLLQIELETIINDAHTSGDTLLVDKILLSQEIWERYRYADCNYCVTDGNSFDMILFIRCAIGLTIKRRDDLNKICKY